MKRQLLISTLLATLLGVGGTALAGEAATVTATGTVKSVDAAKGKLVINHEPIPALNWPQMVMDFQLADKTMADKVKAGDKVQFEMQEGEKGAYTITSIKSAEK